MREAIMVNETDSTANTGATASQATPPPIPNRSKTSIEPQSEGKYLRKQKWRNYAIVTNLSAQTEEYRVALSLHCRGNGLPFAT